MNLSGSNVTRCIWAHHGRLVAISTFCRSRSSEMSHRRRYSVSSRSIQRVSGLRFRHCDRTYWTMGGRCSSLVKRKCRSR